MSEELKLMKAARNSNQGHGHVFTRPDGVRMRCGGPSICSECAKDLAQLRAAWNQRTPPPLDVDRLANIIRTVDGGHTMGAGDLAEAIIKRLGGFGHVED